jgi:hypothetical protein
MHRLFPASRTSDSEPNRLQVDSIEQTLAHSEQDRRDRELQVIDPVRRRNVI